MALGRHYRYGKEIEDKTHASLEEPDLVEIETAIQVREQQQAVLQGFENIQYTIGPAPETHTLRVNAEKIHKDKRFDQSMIDGGELCDPSEGISEWISRSMNNRFNLTLSPLVEVVMLWRGRQSEITTRTAWSEEEFLMNAKARLNIADMLRVKIPGANWVGDQRWVDISDPRDEENCDKRQDVELKSRQLQIKADA
jgi:hypothetical protein